MRHTLVGKAIFSISSGIPFEEFICDNVTLSSPARSSYRYYFCCLKVTGVLRRYRVLNIYRPHR